MGLISLLFVSGPSGYASKSWEEMIDSYDYLDFQLIKKQQTAFKNGKSPKIADSVIKDIPIEENEEKLIDINKEENTRIHLLPNPPEGQIFYGSEYNAGFLHSGKVRKSIYDNLVMVLKNLDKYAEDFEFEKGKIVIKVFEGLRDLGSQKLLFDNKVKEILEDNKGMSQEEAEKEASKWVSPYKNNIPVHSTGAAVDIRLFYKDNFIDMGKFGVIWGSNTTAPTFSEDLTDEQKKNRLFFLVAALKSGLINYGFEWWHVSAGDRYAQYWLQENPDLRIARYGAVEN
jgi:hypothetical protein